MSNEVDLGKEPIGRLLFTLAVPAIASQIVNALYNMVDRMYIGHIADVGANALTGVGVCFPIIMIISAFAALVSMGGAPRASILLGQNNHKGAEKILGNCFSALVLTAIILTVGALLFQKPLLLLFGASENMNAFVSAQGFSKISMMTVVIGAITNIILDPILIYGLNMGVQGAALATIISQAISTIWVLKFLSGSKTTIRLKKVNFKIDAQVLLPSMTLRIAPFIMQATESTLVLCFNSSLLRYGGDTAVGAITILSSVMQFAMLPLQGFTQGGQPIISYNYGAKHADRVKKAFKLLLICCLTYSTVLWALSELFPDLFIAIFTSDPALEEITQWALRVYMGGCLLFGAQIACQQTFIALGNAKTSAFLAMFRKIIVLIPLIYILPMFIENKVFAVFLAEPIADTLAVLKTVTVFVFEIKKVMREMNERKVKA